MHFPIQYPTEFLLPIHDRDVQHVPEYYTAGVDALLIHFPGFSGSLRFSSRVPAISRAIRENPTPPGAVPGSSGWSRKTFRGSEDRRSTFSRFISAAPVASDSYRSRTRRYERTPPISAFPIGSRTLGSPRSIVPSRIRMS